jgi:hypothetical protein
MEVTMRLVSRLAPPAAIVALALAIPAAPASAEQSEPCSNARKAVAQYINEVNFFTGLGGTLEFFGQASQDMTLDANLARDLGNTAAKHMGANC